MKIGIALPNYANEGWRMPTTALREFAIRAESLGFAGLWATDHLCQPPSRNYSRLEPFQTLSYCGGVTTSIPLATGILVLPIRHPVHVAHQAATLQHLASGRFTLGVGAGWVRAEYEATEIPFAERGPRFSESLSLVSQLLTGQSVTHQGRFYDIGEITIEANSRYRPRIVVGGGGVGEGSDRRVPKPVKERILRYADGWIAAPGPIHSITSDWYEIETFLHDNGRDPDSLDRIALNWLHLETGVDQATAREIQQRVLREERGGTRDHVTTSMARHITGSIDDVRSTIDDYAEIGFDELVLGPTTTDPDAVIDQLSTWSQYLQ